MEEKIVFENVRTSIKKIFIIFITLSVLAYIGFVSLFLYSTDYYQHIIHPPFSMEQILLTCYIKYETLLDGLQRQLSYFQQASMKSKLSFPT